MSYGIYIEETCQGTTGDLTLTGATIGSIPFAKKYADTDPVYYLVSDADGISIASGIGVYNYPADTITRTDTCTWDGTTYDDTSPPLLTLSGGTHIVRVVPLGTHFDDFQTAYTYSQVGHLPLTGGVVVGNIAATTMEADNFQFPATQVTNSDPNTLDDYEEGTWTPVLWDSSLSNAESQTYLTQDGIYTKIGNTVTIYGRLAIDSLGTLTLSDDAYIGDLPFTCGTRSAGLVIALMNNFNLSPAGSLGGRILQASSTIQMYVYPVTIGGDRLTISEWSATGLLDFSMTYQV